MPEGLESIAAKVLVKRLNEKRFLASMSGGIVSTGVSDLGLTLSVGRVEFLPDESFSTTISFRACGESSPSVTTSSKGIGCSEKECVLDAVDNYLDHVFPVFCAALGEEVDEEAIDVARITSLCDGDFINWDVYLGPYRIEGAHAPDLLSEIKRQLPITLCIDSIAAYLNERRVHWVELGLTRSDNNISGYVHIDNQDDQNALKDLESFTWPLYGHINNEDKNVRTAVGDFQQPSNGDGCEGFSQFIMLCPSGREVDESTQSDLEQIRESVRNVDSILELQDFSQVSADDLRLDIEKITALLDKIPPTSEIYRARAALYAALGEMENAHEDLSKAIELSPDDLDAYYRRALVNIASGNFEDAERDLESAAKMDERDLHAVSILWAYVILHMTSEQYEVAGEELDRIISLIKGEGDEENDYIFYHRAICNHQLGDFDAALNDLTRAIEINSTYLDAYFERGRILSHLGEHERALSDFSRLLLMAPDRPEYLEARASEYEKLTDFDSALKELQRAEALAPDRASIYEMRSKLLFKLGKYGDTIAAATRAIELLPDFASAYDIRGEAYARIKQSRKAKKDIQKADEAWLKGEQPDCCVDVDWREPESIKLVKLNQISLVDPTESLTRRGSLYQDLGLHEKAVEQFNKALKREPGNPVLLQMRAASYEALDEWDKALADAAAVIALEPDEAGHYYNFGAIYTQKGDLDEALFNFRCALEINPEHAQSHAGAGYTYMAREDYVNALPEYERALKHLPSEPDWLLSKAWCLQALDRLNEAIEALDEAISINNSFADAYYCRGFVYSRMKMRKEALDDFNTAIEYIDDCADYFTSRAWEYFKLGQNDKAEADCQRVFELDSTDPAAYDTLALIRLKSGKLEEALDLALSGLKKASDFAKLHDTLARIYEKLGRTKEAEAERSKAIELGYLRDDDDLEETEQ